MRIDITKNYIRKRLMSPGKCAVGSFRTKNLKGGKKLVTCCPAGQWSSRKQICKVGVKGQSLMTPRKKGKKSKK